MTWLQFNDFVFQGVPGSRLRDLFNVSQFTLAAWSPVLRPLSCSGQLYSPVQVSCILLFRSVVFSCSGQLYFPVQVSCILLFRSVVFSCSGQLYSPVSIFICSVQQYTGCLYLRLQLPYPVVNSLHADF